MKKFGFAATIVGGLAAAIIGLAAPAAAAPTGPGNAQQTISELQAQGYTVQPYERSFANYLRNVGCDFARNRFLFQNTHNAHLVFQSSMGFLKPCDSSGIGRGCQPLLQDF